MNSQKHKRIFHTPGIISAVLLPIAFYFFAKGEIEKSAKTTIRLNWFDTTFRKLPDGVSSNLFDYYVQKRNYTDIIFDGQAPNDEIKLAFAQIRIREILATNDTLNGLHFLFTNKSQYGTFVETIDKLQFEGAKIYIPMNDHLWFYQLPPDTTPVYSGPYFRCGYHDVHPEISWWTKTKDSLQQIWGSSWQLILSFCLFITIILVLKRKNRRD